VALSFLHFVNDANFLLIPTVLPLIAREFNLNYTEIGVLLGCSTLMTIFFQAPMGYFSDLKGRKYLLAFGFLILGIGSILSSIANSYFELLIAQILLGFGASFYHPLSYAWTSTIYEKKGKVKALGIQSSMGDFGIFTVFIINGYLATIIGWRLPLIIFGSLALLSSILPIMLREYNMDRKRIRTSKLEAGNNLKKIFALIIIQFTLAGAYRILYGYTSLILTERGIELMIANALVSVLTLSGIAGSIIMGIIMDNYGEERILAIISIISAVGIAIFGVVMNEILILIILMITGFCIYGIYPGLYSLLSIRINKKSLGLFYGILLSIGMLGGTIGTLIAGVLADLMGIEVTVYIASAFLVIIFVVMTLELLKRK